MKKILVKFTLVLSLMTFAFSVWQTILPKTKDTVEGATRQEKAIDIYLLAGQSNAAGTTQIPHIDTDIYYENVWYAGEAERYTNGDVRYNIDLSQELKVMQGMGYNPNHIGPELGMAHYFNSRYGKNGDKDVAIIKTAAGGTSLLLNDSTVMEPATGGSFDNYGSWYPESLWNVKDVNDKKVNLWAGQYYYQRTGFQYRAFINNIKEEYEYLLKEGYTNIKFKALTWMQGESDRDSPDLYSEVFKVFVNDIRNQISIITGDDYSNMPIVAGEISQTFASSSVSSVNINNSFNAMLNELTGEIKNMFVVPTAGFNINDPYGSGVLGSDAYHWNYEDMVNIGNLFGELAYKAETITKRLYLTTESIKTNSDPEKPSANFATSSYFLDGEDNVTLTFNMARKFNLKDFGIIVDENGTKRSLKDMVTLQFNNKRRLYTVTLTVDSEYMIGDDMRCYAVYADMPKIIVTNSIEGSEYGYNIVTENSGIGYADAPFSFSVFPKEDGRIKSITIGGQPFDFEYGVNDYVIENLSDYWDGENDVVIGVEYEKADEFILDNFKTEYLIGETLDTGYVVKIVNNQGEERVLTADEYTVTGEVDVAKEGTYTLTFSKVGVKSKEIDVIVKYPTIQIRRAQLIYFMGEDYSASELEIEVLGSDGQMKLLDASEYVVDSSEYDKRVVGSYLIKVTATDTNYGWLAYTVDVKKEFTVQISGQKTEFTKGNEFSIGELKVVARDVDGTYNLSEKFFTVDSSAYNKDVVGTYEIKVNVQKIGVLTYSVTLSEKATLEVLGYTENYYVGENFKDTSTSRTITVNKVLNSVKTPLSRGNYKVDYSAFDNTKPGVYTIVVTAKNCEDFTFNVRVKVLYDDFEVSGYKDEYFLGEDLDLSGLVVTGKSTAFGDAVLSSDDYTIIDTTYNKNAVGVYSIYVNVLGSAIPLKEIRVTVKREPILEISNYKDEFVIGNEFNANDLIVKKNDNGVITTLSFTEYTVDSSAYDKTTAGTYTITVSHNGLSASYSVVVKEPTLVSISVSGAKSEFEYNENFSATGVVVIAQYSDNSAVTITDYTVDSSAYDKTTAGTYTITVSHNGMSASYNVLVKEPATNDTNESNGGCAGKALEVLGLVSTLCAIAFIIKKVGL